MVAVAARAAMAWVILMVIVPWAGTVGPVLPPFVRSCGGGGAVGVQEPDVEELYMEESFHSWRGLAKSSEGWRQGLRR
jgi:hypothetical protein